MVTIPTPHEDTAATSGADVSSRRTLLTRLAGLGLVAAGSLALLPEEAEAKPKRRKQRRRRKRRGKGGAKAPRQGSKLSAPDYLPNPQLFHPSYNDRPPQFTVYYPTNGYVWVTVEGRIVFSEEHVTLMRAGRRYRLSCEVWESDYYYTPDDYCFTYLTTNDYPSNESSPPRFAQFFFSRPVPSSWLNHDIDDGIFDSDDDEDDPYARITLTTLPAGSTTWQRVVDINTNKDPGYY